MQSGTRSSEVRKKRGRKARVRRERSREGGCHKSFRLRGRDSVQSDANRMFKSSQVRKKLLKHLKESVCWK